MFEICKQNITENIKLFESFNKCLKPLVSRMNFQKKQVSVDREAVFQKLYLRFCKNILDSFKTTKKMAHRMQIQVSKSCAKTAKNKKSFF